MKKLYKLFLVLCIVTIFAVSAVAMPASAANAVVNGEEVAVGSTVTYIITMSEVPDPVAAIDMRLYYNSDVLELVDKSFSTPGFPGSMINLKVPGEPGVIYMNAASGVDGYPFVEAAQILKVSFKVKSAGEAYITEKILHMFSIYDEYLDRYIMVSDMLVNDKPVLVTVPPIVNTDPAYTDKAVFENRENGLGEKNGIPPDPERTAPWTVPEGMEIVVGPDGIPQLVTMAPADDGNNGQSDNNKNSNTAVIIIAVVIVLLLAAIGAVIIAARNNAEKNNGDKNGKENK